MRIAIIGGGVSGLVAGHRLSDTHDVTLFEANPTLGGHTNTIDVDLEGKRYAVDTGFIVFNDRTYPNFIQLMRELKVDSQATRMNFSVSCEATGLEYRGADLPGLFAQRRNLFRPSFYRMLADFGRFNRLCAEHATTGNEHETVGQFLQRHRLSKQFVEQYFLPMGAAIWSASFDTFRDFPIQFVAEFYQNHGLLGLKDRPQWRVIQGGSRQYIAPLIRNWKRQIVMNQPIEKVKRLERGVQVYPANSSALEFDHVIFACHSDQALRILDADASRVEREVLSAFPYHPNEAILHTQESVLPKNRRAWACWNYYRPASDSGRATVTYNMNLLQSLDAPKVFCVTLNDEGRIRSENIIQKFNYEHPTFNVHRKAMQSRHGELIDSNRTSFCGAYWGNGFHEDGVKSAIDVCDVLTDVSRSVENGEAVV